MYRHFCAADLGGFAESGLDPLPVQLGHTDLTAHGEGRCAKRQTAPIAIDKSDQVGANPVLHGRDVDVVYDVAILDVEPTGIGKEARERVRPLLSGRRHPIP